MTTDTRPDIPLGHTLDKNGKILTFKYDDGWYEYTRDADGRELTFNTSNGYCSEYTRDADGRELTFRDSRGTEWAAIAHDKRYTLGCDANAKMYHAGCRKFTRAEALAHWGTPREDNAERAAIFHAAITNH